MPSGRDGIGGEKERNVEKPKGDKTAMKGLQWLSGKAKRRHRDVAKEETNRVGCEGKDSSGSFLVGGRGE